MIIPKFQNYQDFENFLDTLISVSFFKGLVYSDDFFEIPELKKELKELKSKLNKCVMNI